MKEKTRGKAASLLTAAIVLAMLLLAVFTALPLSAKAQGGVGSVTRAGEHTCGGGVYDTELSAASVTANHVLTAGNYYLGEDISLPDHFVATTGEQEGVLLLSGAGPINICLNGHRLSSSEGKGIVIYVLMDNSAAAVTIDDCDGSSGKHKYDVGPGGNYVFSESGAQEISGGVISGGRTGITVFKGALTLSGGTVAGNDNTNQAIHNFRVGGGIYFYADGSLTLSGGSIEGNAAFYGGGVAGGGGLYINGGTIQRNFADLGGGIYLKNNDSGEAAPKCKLIMSGGVITENSARNYGGIYADTAQSDMIIKAGRVTDNTATNGSVGGMEVGTGWANSSRLILGNDSGDNLVVTGNKAVETGLQYNNGWGSGLSVGAFAVTIKGNMQVNGNLYSRDGIKFTPSNLYWSFIDDSSMGEPSDIDSKFECGPMFITENGVKKYANIGVSIYGVEGSLHDGLLFTKGYGYEAGGANAGIEPSDIFTSDNTYYVISQRANSVTGGVEAGVFSSYTVTYDANGATGGTAPVETAKYSIFYGGICTVKANTDLVRTGYSFLGWNTKADGTGTDYLAEDMFDVTSFVTLYAKWGAYFEVTYRSGFTPYDIEDGTGTGTAPVDSTQYSMAGTDKATVAGKGDLAYKNKIFTGWNTDPYGNGTMYKPGDKLDVTASITLFAQWDRPYMLGYHNGYDGSGPMFLDPTLYNPDGTDEATLIEMPADFVREGYTFVGWATTPATTGAILKPGEKITVNKSMIMLYAQWSQGNKLTYNAGGADGAVPTDSKQYNLDGSESATVLGKGELVKTGHTFIGWNTAANGSGTSYAAGASLKMDASVTLYAQWQADVYTVTLNKNGGTGGDLTSYTYGAGVGLPILTKTGHTFDGWYASADFSGSAVTAISVTDTGNKAYFAKFTADTYTVTLNKDGGTGNELASYTYGVGASLPILTKTGFTFEGWYASSDFSGSAVTAISSTDTGNKTFYAKWAGITPVFHNNLSVLEGIEGRAFTNNTIALAGAAGATVNYSLKDAPGAVTIGADGLLTIGGTISGGTHYFYIVAKNALDESKLAEKRVELKILKINNVTVVAPTATGEVDKPVDIPIDGLDGDQTVTYAPSENGFYTEVKPVFTRPGTYEYWVKVTMPGYMDQKTKVTITITGEEPEPTFEISGTVTDDNDQAVANALIIIRAGSKTFGITETSANGKFTFKDLPKNLYNLVVIFEDTTATTVIDLKDDTEQAIKLPKVRLNSIVDVKEGVTDIVVDGLNDLFSDDDKALVDDADKSVEMKLQVATIADKDISENVKKELANFGGSYLLDITLLKTKLVNGSTDSSDLVGTASGLIKIIIPLPDYLAGKGSYRVLREHNGAIGYLTAAPNADGEYIEVTDGKTVTVYTKNFSQYAIVFDKDVIGGGSGFKAIGDCGAHWFMLLVLACYIVFLLLWYGILRRQRLDFVSFLVTAAFIVLNVINTFAVACLLCLAVMVISWLICLLGALMFIFGKKAEQKRKQKYYEKHPEKKLEAEKKQREKNSAAAAKFAAGMAAKEAKETAKAERERAAIVASNASEGVKAVVAAPEAKSNDSAAVQNAAPALAETGLSGAFKLILAAPLPLLRKTSKKIISNYLSIKYGKDAVRNERPNFISTGLPLADTHFAPRGIVYVGGKPVSTKATKLLQGVCFAYVYELAEDKMMLLIKTSNDHALDILAKGHNIYRSKYPKSGEWFMVAVDDTFKTDQEVFDLLDEAKLFVETPRPAQEGEAAAKAEAAHADKQE